MDDHFHRLTLELLLILLLYPFLFHGSLYSTLSFRVRQIGGVSDIVNGIAQLLGDMETIQDV